MTAKSKNPPRTVDELRQAALDGQPVDPAELAAARAAAELAELQAEGERRRAAEQAEAERQAGLERLRDDIRDHDTAADEVMALAEAATAAVRAFRDAVRARHQEVVKLARRAGKLGAPTSTYGGPPLPGADGICALVGVDRTEIQVVEPDGAVRFVTSHDPDELVVKLLLEIASRLDVRNHRFRNASGEMLAVAVGATARAVRGTRIVKPEPKIAVINRRGQRVELNAKEAKWVIERHGWRLADEPQRDDQHDNGDHDEHGPDAA